MFSSKFASVRSCAKRRDSFTLLTDQNQIKQKKTSTIKCIQRKLFIITSAALPLSLSKNKKYIYIQTRKNCLFNDKRLYSFSRICSGHLKWIKNKQNNLATQPASVTVHIENRFIMDLRILKYKCMEKGFFWNIKKQGFCITLLLVIFILYYFIKQWINIIGIWNVRFIMDLRILKLKWYRKRIISKYQKNRNLRYTYTVFIYLF